MCRWHGQDRGGPLACCIRAVAKGRDRPGEFPEKPTESRFSPLPLGQGAA